MPCSCVKNHFQTFEIMAAQHACCLHREIIIGLLDAFGGTCLLISPLLSTGLIAAFYQMEIFNLLMLL